MIPTSRRTFELSFQIGGNLARSFSNSFSRATSGLSDLSRQSRQTQRALDQLGNDFRRGRITQSQYAESTERLTRELERLERAQQRIKATKSFLNDGINKAKAVASIVAVGTAVAATGLAFKSLNTAADFEQQMTKVGVKAEASKKEMKALKDTALELGAKSSLSASQVAIAMDELAAKGFTTNKIIGAMPGIIAAAESSGEDLALTSDTVTSAINAFNLKASDANHVADVMAMSANRTAAGVADLQYAFKYAAPVAKTLGESLEELAAATGIMVDKGLSGEQAGTSLRMALIRLSKPPKAAQKALAKLNISVTDSQGKFKSLTKLSYDWNKATKKLTQTQKVQYAATVFGTEASTGMLNLFAAGPKKIGEMTKALEKSSGSAKEAAKAMKDNYAGSLEQLSGSIESAQIKFATPILPVFQDVFNGLGSMIDKNMGSIEKAGQKVANNLKDIFIPITFKKPKLTDAIKKDPDAFAQYQKELAKYTKFQNMDFGDKMVYSLDIAMDKVSEWVDGTGGDSMDKIFTKLAEIGVKAWSGALSGTVTGSAGQFSKGNIAAGIGLGFIANYLSGGLIGKGLKWAGGKGISGAKAIKNKYLPGRNPPTPPPTTDPPPITDRTNNNSNSRRSPSPSSARRNAQNRQADNQRRNARRNPIIDTPLTEESTSRTVKVIGKIGKALGKISLPITAAAEGYNVYKASDKTKAVGKAIGGVGGGWAGAEAGAAGGAALGTMVFPGIGTAIGGLAGGLVGGFGGYSAGKWVGGKAVDKVRQTAQPVPQTQSAISTDSLNQSTQRLKSQIDLSTKNFTSLTMYTGQASGWIVGAFTGIKTSADLVKTNLDGLTMYTGQASGWLASLSGIQTAGERVIKALNNLEARINNIELPGAKSKKRVSYGG